MVMASTTLIIIIILPVAEVEILILSPGSWFSSNFCGSALVRIQFIVQIKISMDILISTSSPLKPYSLLHFLHSPS